ncbi:MAG: ABC transporter permease [bacterium]|nr:ABC transporter permease [bacterium]
MDILTLTMLGQTLRISVPYILAALGGTFSERSGVVNIALEGMLLTGAFCSVLLVYYLGNPWLGLIGGIIGGVILASIHAFVCVKYKADQIVSGVALNLLAVGLTKFMLKIIFGSASNSERIAGLPSWDIPGLEQVPVTNPFVLLTIGIVICSHGILYYTPFGLRLRAVGEHPAAADTLGISVSGMRYAGVFISGILAGLGGAYLALDQHQFTDGMSSGRGFIALAAMIFGKWTPLGATAACLLFGFAESFQIHLQNAGYAIPTQLIQMIPYLLTIIALAGIVGRSTPPAAVGKPYEKE